MGRAKKDINIEIGARLKTLREERGFSQSEFAGMLGMGDEHYRKLECGSTGLTTERVYALHEKLNIDPTFLIIGERDEAFDFDRYVINCSQEQRNLILKRLMEYVKIHMINGNAQ